MGLVQIDSSRIRYSSPPNGVDPQIFNEVKSEIVSAMMYANIIGGLCCLAFSLFLFPWGILCGLMLGPMASISRVNNSCQEVCRRANFRHFSNRTVYIWNADSSTLQIATDDHGAVGTGGAIPVVTIASYAPQPQPIHIANAVYVVDEPRPVLVEAHRGISQYAVQPQGRYAPQANYTPQAIYTPQQGPAYGNGAFAVHPQ